VGGKPWRPAAGLGREAGGPMRPLREHREEVGGEAHPANSGWRPVPRQLADALSDIYRKIMTEHPSQPPDGDRLELPAFAMAAAQGPVLAAGGPVAGSSPFMAGRRAGAGSCGPPWPEPVMRGRPSRSGHSPRSPLLTMRCGSRGAEHARRGSTPIVPRAAPHRAAPRADPQVDPQVDPRGPRRRPAGPARGS